jgi:hypothetical protein
MNPRIQHEDSFVLLIVLRSLVSGGPFSFLENFVKSEFSLMPTMVSCASVDHVGKDRNMPKRNFGSEGCRFESCRMHHFEIDAVAIPPSQLVVLFPIFARRHAVKQFVGEFVVGDLFGRGVECKFGVHSLRDDPQRHRLT